MVSNRWRDDERGRDENRYGRSGSSSGGSGQLRTGRDPYRTESYSVAITLREAIPAPRGGVVTRTIAVSLARMSTDSDTFNDTAAVTTTNVIAPVSVTVVDRVGNPPPSDTGMTRTGRVSMAAVLSGAAASTVRTGEVARAWAATSVATGEVRAQAIAGTKAHPVAGMVAIGTGSAAGGIARGRCALVDGRR